MSSTVTRRKGIRNKEVSWRLAPTAHVICLLPRNLLFICEYHVLREHLEIGSNLYEGERDPKILSGLYLDPLNTSIQLIFLSKSIS